MRGGGARFKSGAISAQGAIFRFQLGYPFLCLMNGSQILLRTFVLE
ncbi:MAG: hypothetical protein LBV49_00425 [Azonexus sp.]|nr:hypothetical protein [Azonexus sp.]